MQGLPDQRVMTQGQQMANSGRGGMTMPPMNVTHMPMNLPPNMIMSPRETFSQQHVHKNMVESINHNIPTAESMYTPIPPELLQKQFVGLSSQGQFATQMTGHIPGQLPPGVIPGRGLPTQGFAMQGGMQGVQQQRVISQQSQQFYPPNMMSTPQTNGNYVYTRRIIDPNSGGVMAE